MEAHQLSVLVSLQDRQRMDHYEFMTHVPLSHIELWIFVGLILILID